MAHHVRDALRFIKPMVLQELLPRQNNDLPPGFVAEDGRVIPWWYTKTGIIVKWSLFLGFTVLIGGYLIGGYIHAKRRIRKGLPPLAYHRWLVSRAELASVDPRYAYPQPTAYSTYRPEYYGMQAMPPPVYDPNSSRPPLYQPPDGSTKLDPSQWRAEPNHQQTSDVFAPPPGPPPPPAAVTANHTGASNNPYRP